MLVFIPMQKARPLILWWLKKTASRSGHSLKVAYAKFITLSGEFIYCKVLNIQNDSIYFKEVVVRQVGTPYGVPRLDTMATPEQVIYFTDIAGIPREKEGFSYVKNGSILMLGGAGFILINLVNGAYLQYPPFGKENRGGLAIATGVFGAGLLLNKLHKPYLKIGKRYSLSYVDVK